MHNAINLNHTPCVTTSYLVGRFSAPQKCHVDWTFGIVEHLDFKLLRSCAQKTSLYLMAFKHISKECDPLSALSTSVTPP